MSDNQHAGKSFLIGAVVGGVVGAVTALLLAPKTGGELRGDIKEQVQQAAEKTQGIAKNIGDQASEWIGKAKEAAHHVAEDLRSIREVQKETAAGIETVGSEVDAK